MRISDEMVSRFIEMGLSIEIIGKATETVLDNIEENKREDSKYTSGLRTKQYI